MQFETPGNPIPHHPADAPAELIVDSAADPGGCEPTAPACVLRLVESEAADEARPLKPESESPTELFVFPVDEHDRRAHRRFAVARAGKVFRRSTQQFISASSVDVSYSGALVEISQSEQPGHARGMSVGELVDVGLAVGKRAVMPSASLLQGMVVRVDPGAEGRQRVAIRYLHAGPAAKAA